MDMTEDQGPFHYLYLLLGAGGEDLSCGGPHDARLLARAVRTYGIDGRNGLGDEGGFEQDSPEAQEAIAAVLEYGERLDAEDGDHQAFWAVYADGGPLHRYGWYEVSRPPFEKLLEGDLVRQRDESWLKRQRNNEALIAALAAALRGELDGQKHPSLNSDDAIAKQIDVWAKAQGISGLGEGTVKPKIREALANRKARRKAK